MKVHGEPIPAHKINQFHEILRECGGYYIRNPEKDYEGNYRVSYAYDDIHAMNRHNRLWCQTTADIQEVRKDQWYRKLFRRMKNIVRTVHIFYKFQLA